MDTPTQSLRFSIKSSVLIPESLTSAEVCLLDTDPLLSGIGIGTELWADEHTDEYVARLRKAW